MDGIPTAAARRPHRGTARAVPVSVNGVVISNAAIVRETQHHRASDPDEVWMLASRALAIRELLAQEADRLGIAAEPMSDAEGRTETLEEARLRALIEQEVIVPQADEATCRRYYEGNRRRFRSPDLFEVAHILLPAVSGGEAARAAARLKAQALIAELQHRPDCFAAMAAASSACPSAQQGGNLGQIGPGQTVAEFEAALRTMAPGAIHPHPVETRYGVHVVRLDRRIDGRELPFEAIHRHIAEYLDEGVRCRALQQYVSVLAGRAKITGVDLAPTTGPLVQ